MEKHFFLLIVSGYGSLGFSYKTCLGRCKWLNVWIKNRIVEEYLKADGMVHHRKLPYKIIEFILEVNCTIVGNLYCSYHIFITSLVTSHLLDFFKT